MRRAAAALILLVVNLGEPAVAQEKPVVPYAGVEIFERILHQDGELRPVTDPVAQPIATADTLLIAFGKLSTLDASLPPGGLAKFLADGGNALLAGDEQGKDQFATWQLTISPLAVALEGQGFQNQPACPIIHADGWRAGHPLFQGLGHGIATNSPHTLQLGRDSSLQRLAWLPGDEPTGEKVAFPIGEFFRQWPPRKGQPKQTTGRPLFMAGSAADSPARGRLVVLAGDGVFINCMLAQPDEEVDNFAFAVNCVRWLREKPGDRQRTHALFLRDGQVRTNFNPVLSPPLPIPVPPITALNHLLRRLEDEGFFSRFIDEWDLGGPLTQGLAFSVTVLLLLAGGVALVRARAHVETTVPLLVGAHAAPFQPAAGLEDRHRELLRRNNLGEAAQSLARDWCATQLGLDPARWLRDLRNAAPAFDTTGGILQRWRLRRQARAVWQLAQAAAGRVTRARLLALARLLPTLTRALNEGRLVYRGCSVREKT